MSNVLEMKGIRKHFFGVEVLHGVDFCAEYGKVTALVGENGAGKSTLVKILMGVHAADAGEIHYNGAKIGFQSPIQALANGISMIHQEIAAVPEMSVAENIFLGREPSKLSYIRKKEQSRITRDLLEELGIKLNPDTKAKEISVSEMQLMDIAKAISYNSNIIIMDEPTSSLTTVEIKVLFEAIRRLTSRGVSIIYITHKLEELFEIADHVTVLRDGDLISSNPIATTTREKIISDMVGRSMDEVYPVSEKEIGQPVLKVSGLNRKNVFQDISFELHKGEVLGFAGMVGSGRTETLNAIFGIDAVDSGAVFLNGEQVRIDNPKKAIAHKIAFITEDRRASGLNTKKTVRDNICSLVLSKLARGGFILKRKEHNMALPMVDQLKIKIVSTEQLVSSLSGGNQQKVVIAKWLLSEPDIIFMDEPTRGIDVGAKHEIYKLTIALAEAGKAVLFVSSEMPELLGVCDRIMVFREGSIAGEVNAKEATQEMIMEIISKKTSE